MGSTNQKLGNKKVKVLISYYKLWTVTILKNKCEKVNKRADIEERKISKKTFFEMFLSTGGRL